MGAAASARPKPGAPPQPRPPTNKAQLRALVSLQESLGAPWSDEVGPWLGIEAEWGKGAFDLTSVSLALDLKRAQQDRLRPTDCPKLSGKLPDNLGGMGGKLHTLVITNHVGLKGTIPRSVARLKTLRTLDLSGNRLRGPIPPGIGELRQLVRVVLSANLLTGQVPPRLCMCKKLEVFSVRDNKLTRPLDDATFAGLEALRSVDLSGNAIAGPIPASLGDCGALSRLDLSGNRLVGEYVDRRRVCCRASH